MASAFTAFDTQGGTQKARYSTSRGIPVSSLQDLMEGSGFVGKLKEVEGVMEVVERRGPTVQSPDIKFARGPKFVVVEIFNNAIKRRD